jgi:NADH-quinone oxidoreductase subunit N
MAGYTITVVLAVLFSAISAYFYLRVVRYMYMSEAPEQGSLRLSPGMSAALGLCVLAVIGLGLFPGGLLDWAATAISG